MATETTLTSAQAWSPDITAIASRDAVPDALVLQTSTVAGRVEGDAPAVRVMYIDDATAGFVDEGADIPESDPDLAEALVYTGKVSQLVRLSREQWVQPNASALLSESVRRAVTKAGDLAYLSQAAPAAPDVTPPAGLLNVSGIVDGGAVADDLDALVDLLATLAGNGATPSQILLDPVGWASLRKFKTQTGSAMSLLGAGTSDTVKQLLDVPVIVSPALTTGTGMVIDRTAVVSAVGAVMVAQSEHAYFRSDSIGLRCTWRFGANAVRPDRIGKFTVTAPS
jgi:HK97 family phage major capsid protein